MSNNTGIYTITNIVTTGKYVGSAVSLSERDYRHFKDLKKGIHHSRYLQRAYNKYGLDNFIFEVIEYVDNKEDLIVREQYYIDTLKPVYNICKIAGSTLGIKASKETKLKLSESHKGIKQSEETIRKRSEAQCGNKNHNYGKHPTEETLFKMSEANRGKKLSEETIFKMSKPFKLLSPQGIIIKGINLHKFCIENNLNSGNMYKVMNNKRRSCQGWRKA